MVILEGINKKKISNVETIDCLLYLLVKRRIFKSNKIVRVHNECATITNWVSECID
jgi:hypothetical protein